MKKYIYKLGILCALAGLLFSCQITELPYTSLTDEELDGNPDAVEAITNGNYSQFKSREFIKAWHYIGEYGSDNISVSGATTDAMFFIYNFQRVKQNGHLANQWSIFNRVIINCNKIIGIAKEGESPAMDHLIGENYFTRAWLWFQLATTYGRTYHVANSDELGTPVKLSTDIEDFPLRSDLKLQYLQIVKDLLKAEELMGNSGVEKASIYANVWAAKALLSRVYLTMHDYPNAEKYATDVIDNSGKTLITANSYSTMNEIVPESNTEAIFAIRRTIAKDLDDPGNDIGSMYCRIDNVGWGEFYASQSLRDLFEKHPGDVRSSFIRAQYLAPDEDGVYTMEFETITRNYLIDDAGTADPQIQGKYRTYYRFGDVKAVADSYEFVKDPATAIANFEVDENGLQRDADGYFVRMRQVRERKDDKVKIYGDWFISHGKIDKKIARRNDYPQYFMYKCSYQEKTTQLWSPIVLRLSEMYLNRAEARLLSGNSSGAIDDMNVIKERAGIPVYNLAKDGADVLDALLDERRRELFLEAHRFFDLMRNDKIVDRAYPGGHDRGAVSAVKMFVKNTDNCAIQYIPEREIEQYLPVILTQNPDQAPN